MEALLFPKTCLPNSSWVHKGREVPPHWGSAGLSSPQQGALEHFTKGNGSYHREEENPSEAYARRKQELKVWGPSTVMLFTRVQRNLQPESLVGWTRELGHYHLLCPVTAKPNLLWSATAEHPCTGSRHPYKCCLEASSKWDSRQHPAQHVCALLHMGSDVTQSTPCHGRWTPTCSGGWPIRWGWEEQNKEWTGI